MAYSALTHEVAWPLGKTYRYQNQWPRMTLISL